MIRVLAASEHVDELIDIDRWRNLADTRRKQPALENI